MTQTAQSSFEKYFRDILSLSQSAALACFPHIGSGNKHQADKAATEAMRKTFQKIKICGQIVIGEGERDLAPMLYIGEKTGRWNAQDPEWDIAVDPLEGTNLCAKAVNGAVCVLAVSQKSALFKAPDTYMEKIACGPALKGQLSLNYSVEKNLKITATALNKKITDIIIAVLDRPRHKQLLEDIRKTGAKVQLIEDGDLMPALLTAWPSKDFSEDSAQKTDLVMGAGGAPEGVLSAAALKCLGGGFQGKLKFRNEEEKQRAKNMGIADLDKIYTLNELVKKPTVFCVTGVTDGALLKGVKKTQNGWKTESLYMDSAKKEYCIVQTFHPR